MENVVWFAWSLVGLFFGGVFLLIAILGLVYPAINRRKRRRDWGMDEEMRNAEDWTISVVEAGKSGESCR